MQKRHKIKKHKSKRLFRKTADRTHMFNAVKSAGLRRGGIRL